MTFKKCDRCGCGYNLETHQCGVITVSVYDSNHSSWPGGNSYDFCPLCMHKLDIIINNFKDKQWAGN